MQTFPYKKPKKQRRNEEIYFYCRTFFKTAFEVLSIEYVTLENIIDEGIEEDRKIGFSV